ncbi:MAG: RhoGEF domain-containing protein, partial [archaeon]|nr:RhoGEF domain-containing protein [archaeon]
MCEGCKETYNGPGGISELQAKLGLGTSARMSSSIVILPLSTSPGSNDAPPPGLTVPPPPERPAAGPSSDDVKKQRYFVVREFVDTEESYVRSLDLILSKFLMPCRVQKLLPLLEFGEIFSNVEIVAMANTDLSKDLRTVFQQAQTAQASTEETYPDVSIGYTFLNHVRQLIPIYTPYCLNQTKAVATYERVTTSKKYALFAKLVTDALADPACDNLPLMSFLIKPVQRLCKYPLLLRELLKSTP